MRRLRLSPARIAIRILLFSFLLLSSVVQPAAAGQAHNLAAVRWDEQTPGCTFSHSDDGKLHYGLWSGDLGITLSLDSQELEKVHRRHEPFFGIFLNLRYRGAGLLDLATDNISLQFLGHFKVVQTSLDPEAFAQKVQDDADALDHATAREVAKHPETQAAKQAYMRAFQKDTSELLEFVSKNSLRPARLDAANQEASGWVLFAADSKWIGKWKKKEDFILRIPVEGKIFEFPFTLPPKPADLTLRRRD
jgi:hypothetical protein